MGDDVYAGKKGNVYKRNSGGSWDRVEHSGNWSNVPSGSRTVTLNNHSTGQMRTQNYGRSGGYGGGGRRGGGRRR